MQRFRPRASYANAMATIAVFIALGGGAYAAVNLPKNSVGSKQIKNNAVNSAKVKDRSLLSKDFKAGQLPRGVQGLQGLKGDPGQQGPKGDTGPPGPTMGASTGLNSPAATPNDSTLWATTNITTPTQGSLFVLGTAKAGMSCTAGGGCNTTWGVYLDGAPVPNTGQVVGASASSTQLERITMAGIAPNVPAGDHTLTIKDNGSANVFSTQMQDRSLTGILLGG